MIGQHEFIRSKWIPPSILIAHLVLGVLYSVATPIWESYDEWGHYPYVRYVATEHELPRRELVEENDETHQPPLYYVLGALATFWMDVDDELEPIENQYSVHRGGNGGVNFFLHLEEERFPYSGAALAFHITRLVSVLLSTVVVGATYLIGRTLFPTQKTIALGAMAVNAFWPQFLFLGSVVSNDIMITACASLVLLFLVRFVMHSPQALDLFGLGICLGGALISKRNGLALVPLVAIGLVIAVVRWLRMRNVSVALLGWGLLLLTGVALASAWWLEGLRESYQGYILRIGALLSHPSQVIQLHWQRLPSAVYFCLITFFAAFGHLIVGVEVWIYKIVGLFCLAACLGLAVFFVDKKSNRLVKIGVLVLLLHSLAIFSAPLYVTLTADGNSQGPTIVGPVARGGTPITFSESVFGLQGRFVLPAISAFSLLLLTGLANLVPKRIVRPLAVCVGSVLFAFATLVPFRYILPVYAKPALLSPSEVQNLERPLTINFGGKIELLGYELDREEVTPGNRAPVILYWRCLSEMEQDYTLTVRILGQDSRVFGALRLHPGHGNFPTSLWKEGDTFREIYWVPVTPNVPAPSLVRFRVGFSTPEQRLTAVDSDEDPVPAVFGQLVIRPPEQPDVENPVYYDLGGKVALVGYAFDLQNEGEGEVGITLYWQALAEMERGYTVFVHLMDEDNQLAAQRDSQPRDGTYPTRVWKEGETIRDTHLLSLPPSERGRYQITVGMYDPTTLFRLPCFDADGSRLLHDVIPLGEIELPPNQ
ncbi:MAG: DUF2142 domain-containing protein [Anaerolineae bacterium]|jgi:4-amino-4-deoxy-L-arabinose transferase-like glycosyltransferase